MVENRRKCRRYRVATGRSGVELLAGRGNLFKGSGPFILQNVGN